MSDPIRNLTLSLLVLSAAPALARAQTPVDTVITVQPGGRLEVENFQGSVTIGTWDRNAVRVARSASCPAAVSAPRPRRCAG